MAYVTLDKLYDKIVKMEKELQELRSVFIQEEEISGSERRELKSLFKQIEEGRGRPWREVREE